MNDSSCAFEIIYSTIKQAQNKLSVKELCTIAGVSRSGYYAWLKAAPEREKREQQDRNDFDLILSAYKMHGYAKGAKGIYMALLHMDTPVVMNLKKIRRLMDKFNLSCPFRGPNPYKRMAAAMKDHIKPKLANCPTFADVEVVVDDYMDYYNNRRYQWKLAKLSPNEFYNFVTTGEYPLDIPKVPSAPLIQKNLSELGRKEFKETN